MSSSETTTTGDAAATRLDGAMAAAALVLISGAVLNALVMAYPSIDAAHKTLKLALMAATHGPVLLFAAWRCATDRHRVAQLMRRDPWWVLLVALAGLSALWSVSPARTVLEAGRLAGVSAVGLFFLLRFSRPARQTLLLWFIAAVTVASWLVALAWPDVGVMQNSFNLGHWRGVFAHKNELGVVVALGALLGIGQAVARRRLASLGAATALACLVTLALSRSLGPAVALGVAITMGGLAWCWGRPIAPLLGWTFLALALLFPFEETLPWIDRDPTLTGRTLLWKLLLEPLSDRPWLGHGYGVFWRAAPAAEAVRAAYPVEPYQAHSGWLELGLGLGAVGVGLFVVQLVQTGRRLAASVRRAASADAALDVAIVTFVMVLALVEAPLLCNYGGLGLAWLCYALTALGVSRAGELA